MTVADVADDLDLDILKEDLAQLWKQPTPPETLRWFQRATHSRMKRIRYFAWNLLGRCQGIAAFFRKIRAAFPGRGPPPGFSTRTLLPTEFPDEPNDRPLRQPDFERGRLAGFDLDPSLAGLSRSGGADHVLARGDSRKGEAPLGVCLKVGGPRLDEARFGPGASRGVGGGFFRLDQDRRGGLALGGADRDPQVSDRAQRDLERLSLAAAEQDGGLEGRIPLRRRLESVGAFAETGEKSPANAVRGDPSRLADAAARWVET